MNLPDKEVRMGNYRMNDIVVRLDLQLDAMRYRLQASMDSHFENIKKVIDNKVSEICTADAIERAIQEQVDQEVNQFIDSVREEIRRKVAEEFSRRVGV